MTNDYRLMSEKIIIYIFDLLSFSNYLSNKEFSYNLKKIAEDLRILSDDLTNKETDTSKYLQKIQKSFDDLINKLKYFKCPDNLLTEKADLSVRAFIIREQCNKLLFFVNLT